MLKRVQHTQTIFGIKKKIKVAYSIKNEFSGKIMTSLNTILAFTFVLTYIVFFIRRPATGCLLKFKYTTERVNSYLIVYQKWRN